MTFYRKRSTFQNIWRRNSGAKCTWNFDVKRFANYSFSYRALHNVDAAIRSCYSKWPFFIISAVMKLPVKVYSINKATPIFQKKHTFTGDIWIIWGMIRRADNLKNTTWMESCFWICADRWEKSMYQDVDVLVQVRNVPELERQRLETWWKKRNKCNWTHISLKSASNF